MMTGAMTTESGLTIEELDDFARRAETAKGRLTPIPHNLLCKVIAAARQSLEAGEWQPIDSAPKNVGDYLVWVGEPIFSHQCRDGKWWENGSRIKPTHWMPFKSPAASAPASACEHKWKNNEGICVSCGVSVAPPAQSEPVSVGRCNECGATFGPDGSSYSCCIDHLSDGDQPTPTADKPVDDLKERLSTYSDKKNRERFMEHWDSWRSYIARGGDGSKPRDGFESWVDEWWDDAKEALARIEALEAARLGDQAVMLFESNKIIDRHLATIATLQEKLDRVTHALEWFYWNPSETPMVIERRAEDALNEVKG